MTTIQIPEIPIRPDHGRRSKPMKETTMEQDKPKQITITLDAGWESQIANYNMFRDRVRETLKRDADRVLRDGPPLKRGEVANAQKAYANACMSMGWMIAAELREQGIEIDS